MITFVMIISVQINRIHGILTNFKLPRAYKNYAQLFVKYMDVMTRSSVRKLLYYDFEFKCLIIGR